MTRKPLVANPAAIAILAAVYLAAAKFSLLAAFVQANATAIWPPTGIALAACLAAGYAVWPGIFLGAFLANLTTEGTVATSLGIALGNTLEGVLGAYLVNRYANGCRAFDRTKDALKFAVLAGLGCTMVSPLIGVLSLALGGYVDWGNVLPIWMTWWLGDAGGALVVAPPLILWWMYPHIRWTWQQWLEAGVLLLLVLFAALAVFGGLLPHPFDKDYPISTLVIPILIVVAFRFGQRETATASLLLAAIATWGTLRGFGPFSGVPQNEALLLLQAFLGVAAVTAMALAADIAERKRVEAALIRQTQELARSNAELEQYAYVASHDLREPLGIVANYVQLLARRYKDKLDQDARDFMGYAVDAVAQMRALIDALLAYSRVGRSDKSLEPTDCNQALKRALSNLKAQIEESEAMITVGPLPMVKGDALRLTQMFQNLVSNAIKFRSEKKPAVHILARRRGSEWFFSLSDNGIGIDPQYADRIFVIFQRLHEREEYPGTGIGLAMCKRIIELHGGRIWMEPRTEGGTTFHFTLPAVEGSRGRVELEI